MDIIFSANLTIHFIKDIFDETFFDEHLNKLQNIYCQIIYLII